jgi:hypothetical protein
MVGVFPLFVAFALFGMVQFGYANYRFSSWQRTFVEMFAVRGTTVHRCHHHRHPLDARL